MKKSRFWAYTFLFVYLALCLLSAGLVVWSNLFGGGKMELAGIGIFILGLPWSLIGTFVVSGMHSSSAWLMAIMILLSCALNGWLVFKVGSFLD